MMTVRRYGVFPVYKIIYGRWKTLCLRVIVHIRVNSVTGDALLCKGILHLHRWMFGGRAVVK